MGMADSSVSRRPRVQPSGHWRRAAALGALSVGCTVFVAGCPGMFGPGEPKKYSGGGPIPEVSEVLEKVAKMPPVGRYAPDAPAPRPGRRGARARKGP